MMSHAAAVVGIRMKYEALSAAMDERLRRHWAATEAQALGYGGITAVAAATAAVRFWVVREIVTSASKSTWNLGSPYEPKTVGVVILKTAELL